MIKLCPECKVDLETRIASLTKRCLECYDYDPYRLLSPDRIKIYRNKHNRILRTYL